MSLYGNEFQIFHENRCRFSSALQLERHHAAGTIGQIFHSELVKRIRRKSAIIYMYHLIMAVQKFRDLLSVLAMARHPDMETFESKVNIEGMLRRLNGTEVTHQLSRALCDKSAFLSESLRVSDAVIGIIRSAETGELVRMRHPVKFTGIHDGSADSRSVSVVE